MSKCYNLPITSVASTAICFIDIGHTEIGEMKSQSRLHLHFPDGDVAMFHNQFCFIL